MRMCVLAALVVLCSAAACYSAPAMTPEGDCINARQSWRVEAYFWTSPGFNRCRVEMRKHPGDFFSWSVDTAKLKLSVLKDGSPTAMGPSLRLAPDTPAVLRPVRDKDRFDRATLNLVVDRNGAPEGRYAVRISGPVDAVDAKTGEAIAIRDIDAPGVVNIAWMPMAVPQLVPGQKFLFMPPKTTRNANPYVDAATGASVPWKDMVMRILELRRVQPRSGGKSRIDFAVEGRKGLVAILAVADIDALPLIAPIAEDPLLAPQQKRLGNKRVWAYGGIRASLYVPEPAGVAGVSGSPTDSAVITKIIRLYTPEQPLNSDSWGFRVDNPIVVLYRTPLDVGVTMGSWAPYRPSAADDNVFGTARSKATGCYAQYCDPQEIERSFSLKHPFKLHPEWSRKMRSAISRGDIVGGMSRDEAAWSWGWPYRKGTIAELKKLDSWNYGYNSIDFHNGKVVFWGSDITLP